MLGLRAMFFRIRGRMGAMSVTVYWRTKGEKTTLRRPVPALLDF